MLASLLHFVRYNNGFPLLLLFIFLGGGGVFAASPEVRSTIIASEQVVRSIDNTRIVGLNLETYDVVVTVVDVAEDEETYYVSYTMDTIELVDSVWQDVRLEKMLVVPKNLLDGRDLGRYASKELGDVRAHELARLRETQQFEKEIGASQKVVATVYSGLVGRMLSGEEETFPGYVPVVPDIVADTRVATPEENAAAEARLKKTSQNQQPSGSASAPTVTLLGKNPTRVPLGATYVDLGVVVSAPGGENIPYTVLINGRVYDYILLDTTMPNSYTITYRATSSGGTGEAVRTVIVYDPTEAPVSTPPTPSETTTSPVSEEETSEVVEEATEEVPAHTEEETSPESETAETVTEEPSVEENVTEEE